LWALFITSRLVIIVLLAGRHTDLGVHWVYVSRIFLGDEIPFRDFFPEYPPLVFLFTMIPAAIDRSFKHYFPLFRGMCCIVDCGIWMMLLWQAKQGRIGVPQLVLYILGTTALGAMTYDRIDIVLAAILLVAAIALRDGRVDTFHLALGVGIAFKLIPVVFVPMALVLEWKRPDRRLVRALFCITLPTLISFAAVAMAGGYHFDKLFEYHHQRGIHMASVPGSLEMILMNLGVEGEVYVAFGSNNLRTPWERPLATAASVMLALLLCGSAIIAARKKLDGSAKTLLFGAVLSGALVCSKVLSAHFLLFLLPVLVILPVPGNRWAARAMWILIAVIYLLAGILYPWLYEALVRLDPIAEFLVILRNACLIGLGIALTCRTWKSPGR